MIQEVVIAAFVLVTLQGVAGGGASGAMLSGWWAWAACLAPFAALAAVSQLRAWWALRRLNRGDQEAIGRLERTLMVLRGLGLLVHGVNCLVLGWPALVRSVTGDLVAVDEWLAAAPPLLLVLGGWWWMEPVDRRMREAILARQLHEGTPIPGWPSRAAYVAFWARQSMLPVLAPVLLISVWGEGVEKFAALFEVKAGSPGVVAVQFLGIATILALGALVLRRVWHTEPITASSVRDRLMAVCARNGVRIRDLLLWRTGGTIHNAAVLGFLPRARFILVTDAMIEHFPEELLEAVASHEVGHVRRRHLIWLALSTLAAVLVVGLLTEWVAWRVLVWGADRWGLTDQTVTPWRDLADGATITLTLLAALAWFGWVSRRFERQADAFAAWDLTRASPEGLAGGRVTSDAAGRVMEALGMVAAYNGMSATRFMWRHGSIRTRQMNLSTLIGRPLDALPIDRLVGWIKVLTVLGLLAGGAAAASQSAGGGG